MPQKCKPPVFDYPKSCEGYHQEQTCIDPPRFSLIIPAYNEETYLPRLLDTVDKARASYHGGAEAIEVVVADNASTDATARLARERGCRVVFEEKRIIAAVRNRGARMTRGQVLAFIDADSQIHPDTFNAIERSLSTGKVVAGSTGVTLERISLGLAVTYIVMVPMTWLTGLDIGVVFCRRDDFEAVGGYNEERLFAEDVQFLLDMRRLGRSRGQKLSRVTSAKAIASTRKFDKYGDWHYLSLIPRFFSWLLFSTASMEDFAQTYWYSNQR